MSWKSFFRGLGLTTFLAALTAVGFHSMERLTAHWPLSLVAILFYIALSVGMYYLGERTAKAENRHQFTSVTMGFTFLKMMASAGIIVVYLLLFEPADKLFVLPFFLIYILYTAFEMVFMIKLARQPKAK